ncbi:MAG TPA: hypothetical protein ENN05_11485 [Deltaproteobacteria bacterium]|nr:hypothetical protein [Deltaproteobacteria bacterium]
MKYTHIRDLISSRYIEHEWCLIQERSIRRVYRLDRGTTPEYFVKIYDPEGPVAKLRNLLRPRTLHEADMLRHLKGCGLNVPEVVDHIRLAASSALITKAVHPCRGLHDLERQKQASVMLDMTVELLKNGFFFSDMHLGNIVLDDSDRPYLLDVYEVNPCRVIRPRHVIALFSQVLAVYDIGDDELEDALKRIGSLYESKGLAQEIRAKALHSRRRYVKKLVERCLKPGIFTHEIKGENYRAYVFMGDALDLESLLGRHVRNIAERRNVLKYQEKTQLSEVDSYCVKTYKRPGPLCSEYALRSWKGLLTLYFNGIGVADPAAVGVYEDRSSVLVTKMLYHPDLDVFFCTEFKDLCFRDKMGVVSAFGEMIGSMHALNIYHADLKACNIKVDPAVPRFYLLDTDRIEQRRFLQYAKRLKNLVQINTSIPVYISLGMRMRFLRAYAGCTGDDPVTLFQDVWRCSEKRDILYCTPEGDHVDSWRCPRA